MARRRWENFPYYQGPCASVEGTYECECSCEDDERDDGDRGCGGRRHGRHCRNGGGDWNDGTVRGNGNDRNGGGNRGNGNGRRMAKGMFLSYLPMSIAANGILPLAASIPCRNSDFEVNSGLITLESAGTYLATYNVRIPEGQALDTTITLNVDDASQSSAVTIIDSAGTGSSAYAAQAIFEADEGTTVSLRTSDAISITDPSTQPMLSLSLVQLEE